MALATNTSEGEIQLTGDLAGDGGAQIGSNPQLTHMPGLTPGQYVNAKVTVDAKGRITAVSAATPAEVGAALPTATTTQQGVVSIGSNLYISAAPTAGYVTIDFGGLYAGSPIPPTGLNSCATYGFTLVVDGVSTYTISDTGANLTTAQDVVDLINAETPNDYIATLSAGNIVITSDSAGRSSTIDISNDTLFGCMSGYVQVITEDGTASCEIYAKDATDSVKGVVLIGDNLSVSNGVLSVDIATPTSVGVVKVPTSGNIDIDGSGNISVPLATSSTVGVVSIGTGLSVDGSGQVTLDLPIADASTLGGVKGGGVGVTIAGDGTISTTPAAIPTATSSTIGGVIVPGGDGLSVDGSGNLTFTQNPATTSSLGSVIVPTSIPGSPAIDNALSVDGSGNISVDLATNTTYGVVKSADTNYINITSGDVSVGTKVAKTDATNSYTKAQSVLSTSLTSSTSISVDASLSNIFTLTLDHNTTLANPTNLVSGGTYSFIITQGSTGGTMTFGTNYKFPSGGLPVLSIGTGDVDILSCISDGTNMYCSINKGF